MIKSKDGLMIRIIRKKDCWVITENSGVLDVSISVILTALSAG